MSMGRPPIYSTPEEFAAVADAYFAECRRDDEDKDREIPTVNGLCLALGMCRETLLAYEDKPEFSDAVKRVRATLENAWEKRLSGNSVAGVIFWLKNQGWSDKTEQTIKADVTVSRIERAIVRPKD